MKLNNEKLLENQNFIILFPPVTYHWCIPLGWLDFAWTLVYYICKCSWKMFLRSIHFHMLELRPYFAGMILWKKHAD